MTNRSIYFTYKKVYILLFLLSIVINVQSQSSVLSPVQNTSGVVETNWNNFTYDIVSIFGGVGYSYKRPLHWKGKQWQTLSMVAAGTGLLFIIDNETSEFAVRQKEGIPNFVRSYGTEFGSPQYNYMFTGGVYLTGLFSKNEKLRRTGVLLVASATSTGLLQQLAKSIVGRARPESGKTKDTFDPFSAEKRFHSFPSGHTMLAFTNAYTIAKHFKNPFVKAGIYTVGLVPGVSRLWDGKHWLTDIALGVAISIFTVESIDRYLDSRYNEKYHQGAKKISWNLNFAPSQIGVTANF